MTLEADVLSPNALGAILDEQSIAALQRADRRRRRQQPARHAARTATASTQRGILYAPDYVINAGGIINVSTEYLKDGDQDLVRAPDRGDSRPARADLGRERRDRPQPGRASPTTWPGG